MNWIGGVEERCLKERYLLDMGGVAKVGLCKAAGRAPLSRLAACKALAVAAVAAVCGIV